VCIFLDIIIFDNVKLILYFRIEYAMCKLYFYTFLSCVPSKAIAYFHLEIFSGRALSYGPSKKMYIVQ